MSCKTNFRTLIIVLTLIIIGVSANAQNPAAVTTISTPAPTEPTAAPVNEPLIKLGDQVKLKIGGFVKSDVFVDTRINSETADGLFLYFPLAKLSDSTGSDINEKTTAQMSAITSRLNFLFTGPEVLNAKTSSFIELDFSGYNSIGVRFRQGWVKLNWTSSEVLFGRMWHPLFQLEAVPTVVALNTGAPFNVFNRCEQLRFTYTHGILSSFVTAAYQPLYGWPTPTATNIERYGVQPDLSANVQLKSKSIILGVTGNIRSYQPKLVTTEMNSAYVAKPKGKTKETNEKLNPIAISGYAQYSTGAFKIKASSMYGESMYEFNMLGGYYVSSIDSTTGHEKYSPLKHLTNWVNILYGTKWQVGLFVGHSKNLGATEKSIMSTYFGRGNDIESMYRIAPSLTYKSGRLLFMGEIENTVANYGRIDFADYAKVKDTYSVGNIRYQFTAMFMF